MRKILIANRGEIAIRVIRTAREMGISTVAVASDADKMARHVLAADQVIYIGGSEAKDSYLDQDLILKAAKDSGADAIHPGYGFLSERAEFSDACRDAGVVFLGPSGDSMRCLGSKIDAKKLAQQSGVPITPGFFEQGSSDQAILEAAKRIGMPVMLKASAGGGGRGMRVVREESELESSLALARSEALSGFGDDSMMVEKLIESPQHIEVQVVADAYGNVLPLFERDCSTQRRHQKLIEEAPSPFFDSNSELWPSLRQAAVQLIKAAQYQGAGTIEFILDRASGEFYFLEVNARLQVEHPVTECITGLDLVRLQIESAQGVRFSEKYSQWIEPERTKICGHSIEARIVAEDPRQNYLPSIGKILAWNEPQGPGIRVDTGYGSGAEVSRYYDSLVAKLIVHAPDRKTAIERLREALRNFHILGIKTNIEHLLAILDSPDFREGKIHTGSVDLQLKEFERSTPDPMVLAALLKGAAPTAADHSAFQDTGAWDKVDGWTNTNG